MARSPRVDEIEIAVSDTAQTSEDSPALLDLEFSKAAVLNVGMCFAALSASEKHRQAEKLS